MHRLFSSESPDSRKSLIEKINHWIQQIDGLPYSSLKKEITITILNKLIHIVKHDSVLTVWTTDYEKMIVPVMKITDSLRKYDDEFKDDVVKIIDSLPDENPFKKILIQSLISANKKLSDYRTTASTFTTGFISGSSAMLLAIGDPRISIPIITLELTATVLYRQQIKTIFNHVLEYIDQHLNHQIEHKPTPLSASPLRTHN